MNYTKDEVAFAATKAREAGFAWLGEPDHIEAIAIRFCKHTDQFSLVSEDVHTIDDISKVVAKYTNRRGYPALPTMSQDKASGRHIGAFGRRIEGGRLTRRERRSLRRAARFERRAG